MRQSSAAREALQPAGGTATALAGMPKLVAQKRVAQVLRLDEIGENGGCTESSTTETSSASALSDSA